MRLSLGQKESIMALSRILPLDVLLKIKEGKIKEFEDLHLNLFDPHSPEERTEMDAILDKEIAERKRRLNRVLHINC
jgi:hypothetical protein